LPGFLVKIYRENFRGIQGISSVRTGKSVGAEGAEGFDIPEINRLRTRTRQLAPDGQLEGAVRPEIDEAMG
jgi:hypothetical protein